MAELTGSPRPPGPPILGGTRESAVPGVARCPNPPFFLRCRWPDLALESTGTTGPDGRFSIGGLQRGPYVPTLTVYFPVEMYIGQKQIPKWTTRWMCLQMLSVACLIISVVAAAGSIAGVVIDLKVYKPFHTSY